jgi:hypothetical protein
MAGFAFTRSGSKAPNRLVSRIRSSPSPAAGAERTSDSVRTLAKVLNPVWLTNLKCAAERAPKRRADFKFTTLAQALSLAAGLLLCDASYAQVQVQQLAAPDLFSIGTGSSDLPADLWQGSSAALVRTMLPRLAEKPLSPAAAALARHLLSAAGNAPEGVGDDPQVAGQRAEVLLRLGDAAGVAAIADHTPQLAQKPELARAAAEAALILGQEDKACALGDALVTGREGVFWLRLRAFCQVRAGQAAPAQLTLDLAQQQARSPDYDRLMAALLSAATGAMPALDDALDFAISKRVSTDWAPALASAPAAIAVAVARDASAPASARLEAAARAARLGLPTPEAYAVVSPPPADLASADQPGAAGEAALIALASATNDLTLKESAVLALLKRARDAAEFQALARLSAPAIDQVMAAHPVLRDPVQFAVAAAAAGDIASAKAARAEVGQGGSAAPNPVDLALLDGLIAAAASPPDPAALDALDAVAAHAEGAARNRTAATLALLGGLGAPLSPQARFDVAGSDLGQSALASGRALALEQAADAGRIGDVALYVLAQAADAGPAGPSPGDRALLVRALARAHLDADARAYAVEGLVALQTRP